MTKTENRNRVLLFSVLITLTCGTPYFWSIFQLYLTDTMGWEASKALLAFSTGMAVFPLGNIVGGRLQDKFKASLVIRFFGIGMGIFLILASFASKMEMGLGLPLLCLTYGLANFFTGGVYNSVLPTVQKWFPDKKGFASGIVVSATGFGGIVFTPYVEFFLGKGGAPLAFMSLGIIYAIIVFISSFFVDPPKEGYLPEGFVPKKTVENTGVNFTTGQMLKTKTYYVLFASMTFSTLSYLMISPTLKGLCIDRGLTAQLATTTVMACALMNSVGRLVNSWASDRMGKKSVLSKLMLLCAASLALLAWASGFTVIPLAMLIAFCYGGYLSINPILTSELFGLKYAGSNYGFVILATGVSALVGPVLLNLTSGMGGVPTAILCAAGISVLAAILMLSLKPPAALPSDLNSTPTGEN